MDLRGGEVRQPTRVVEVKVRRHEVAHVLPPEAERLDLRERRHVRFRRIDRHRWTEERAEPARVTHVVNADARVDEDEPMRFAVEGALAAGAHRTAVEVMDAHGSACSARGRNRAILYGPQTEVPERHSVLVGVELVFRGRRSLERSRTATIHPKRTRGLQHHMSLDDSRMHGVRGDPCVAHPLCELHREHQHEELRRRVRCKMENCLSLGGLSTFGETSDKNPCASSTPRRP